MGDSELAAVLARTDERATRALEEISRHEKACDARYADISKALDALQGRWFWSAVVLVGGLVSLVGYLLVYGAPWVAK